MACRPTVWTEAPADLPSSFGRLTQFGRQSRPPVLTGMDSPHALKCHTALLAMGELLRLVLGGGGGSAVRTLPACRPVPGGLGSW